MGPAELTVAARGVFDWALGFTAQSILVGKMIGAFLVWYRDSFVDMRDPWESLARAFHGESQLSHSSVVLVYRDGGEVRSRCLVRSWPPYLPWGLERLRVCSVCKGLPRDTEYSWKKGVVKWDGADRVDPHATMRQSCKRCGHQSGFVKRPDWVHPVPDYLPCYWLEWPLNVAKVAALEEEFAKPRPSGPSHSGPMPVAKRRGVE